MQRSYEAKDNMVKYFIVALLFCGILLGGSCQIFGIMSTPTRHEKKVPAEYDLAAEKGKTILVYVEQPSWLSASGNLSREVSEALEAQLKNKIKTLDKSLIGYERVSALRSESPEYYELRAREIGRRLDADMVLVAALDEYALSKVIQTEYHKGQLAGRVALIRTDDGVKVWPDSESGKVITVGFDVERGDYSTAVKRLANSFAYCTVRYLYNCPMDEFKIFDDRSGEAWQRWEQ